MSGYFTFIGVVELIGQAIGFVFFAINMWQTMGAWSILLDIVYALFAPAVGLLFCQVGTLLNKTRNVEKREQ